MRRRLLGDLLARPLLQTGVWLSVSISSSRRLFLKYGDEGKVYIAPVEDVSPTAEVIGTEVGPPDGETEEARNAIR